MYYMAYPAWTWGKAFNLETQADLIELRYNSKIFKLIFSSLTTLFWFPWIILELKTIGYVVSAVTYHTVEFNIGVILISIIIIIYCFYGGARAVTSGCIIQGATLSIAGTITSYYLIKKIYGGIIPMFEGIISHTPNMLTINNADLNLWASSILAGILGAFCWPGIFNLLYIAKSPKIIKKTASIVPIITVLLGTMIMMLGLGGRLIKGFPSDAQEGIFWVADTFGGPVVLGMMGISALAACMSTASAVLNTAGVIIAKDFSIFFMNMTRNKIFLIAKISTVVVGLLALWLATINLPNLMIVAMLMYNCIMQAIVPLFIGLYWRKSNIQGALAGMLIGILITIGGTALPETIEWAYGWSAGILGFAANLLIHIILGLIYKKQPHVDKLFTVLEAHLPMGLTGK